MDGVVFLAVLAATSVGGFLAASRVFRLPPPRLRVIAGKTLECLGFGTAFFVANIAAGIAVSLTVRAVTSRFASLYTFADPIVVPLSLLQGLAVWSWREHARDEAHEPERARSRAGRDS